jgi:LSM domain
MVFCDRMTNSVSGCWSFLGPSSRWTEHVTTANLVLEDTVERIYHGDVFAENWHGLFLIRGENVVLLGEIVRMSVLADTSLIHSFYWCRIWI